MNSEIWNQKYIKWALTGMPEHSTILEKQIARLSPGKALDLACGEGRNAFFLAKQGWQVTAVDFSRAGIEKGRELSEKQGVSINWEVQNLEIYTPAPGTWDLVCLFYLHLPKDAFRKILLKAAAALRPGGTLLVTGHDLTNLTRGTGGPQDPEILYTPGDITQILDFLEIEYAETENHFSDHGESDRGNPQIDCVVRAKKKVL